MKAEILSIGTELLLGDITDTNASYLARRLAALGIDCFFISQVGDNLERLTQALARAWQRSDLTVTTGGLGPTQDDLTREGIAAMLDETPSVDAALEARLRDFFRRRGVKMPETNVKQAWLIPSSRAINNPVGTAPGWWVEGEIEGDRRIIVSMPGVPFEMKRMWEREVEPRLRPLTNTIILSRTLKVGGLGESMVEERVADLMSGSNPTLAPYAKSDGIHLRITAKASDGSTAQSMISDLEAQVRERLGDAIFGADGETPQSAVQGLLQSLGLKYALLEVGEITGTLPQLASGAGCVGLVSGPTLEGVAALLGHEADELSIIVQALKLCSAADVVQAIYATVEPVGDEQDAVQVEGEIAVLTPSPTGEDSVISLRQSWRTTRSEVSRLLGLAALNLLRRRLLDLAE